MKFAHKVEDYIHFLIAFPAYLFRRMNNNFFDKFIDDCGCQFRNPHILADNGGKAVKIVPVLFEGLSYWYANTPRLKN